MERGVIPSGAGRPAMVRKMIGLLSTKKEQTSLDENFDRTSPAR
jgi:hypothetical protein